MVEVDEVRYDLDLAYEVVMHRDDQVVTLMVANDVQDVVHEVDVQVYMNEVDEDAVDQDT